MTISSSTQSKLGAVQKTTIFNSAVIVSALGYFVDIYDLLLFSIVRVPSLQSLGVAQAELLPVGVLLINAQMVGMLLGGILWGILGDKRGRISVLFGSILLYSMANVVNAFATTVEQYAILRFVAGVGLAGELGAAITLVTETMSSETRGYGTSVVAGFGLLGAVFAAMIGDHFSWRIAYGIGGGMGVILLVLRISIMESGMFASLAEREDLKRGDIRMLFRPYSRFLRYLRCIVVGSPIWFVVGILFTFAPELSRALGVQGEVSAGKAVLFGYVGLSLGDLVAGVLSQVTRSRKRVVLLFLAATTIFSTVYLMKHGLTTEELYALCLFLGLASGYWAMFVTMAAENFGTNLRATVTTTVPNFVRGLVVPLTLSFRFFETSVGLIESAAIVGGVCVIAAALSLWGMDETFGKNLDYTET